MDTIIYLYKKRDLNKPVIDAQPMKDYLLVRVGLDVGENRWFCHSLTPPEEIPAKMPFSQKLSLKKRWEAVLERWAAIRLQRRQRAAFLEETAQVRKELQDFRQELGYFVEERYDCRCVYGDAAKKWLVSLPEGEREADSTVPVLLRLWQEAWQFPEFDAFFQPQWVEPLLVYARLHHFVILGSAPCMSLVLSGCARRMKSLKWFLSEEACTEELQDLVEDFYDEYGLAIDLHLLEGKRVYSRLLLEVAEPVCVLDFSGEPNVPVSGLARGSIWIDFASVEEKARRMSERAEGIAYFSMKEIWKRAGKP